MLLLPLVWLSLLCQANPRVEVHAWFTRPPAQRGHAVRAHPDMYGPRSTSAARTASSIGATAQPRQTRVSFKKTTRERHAFTIPALCLDHMEAICPLSQSHGGQQTDSCPEREATPGMRRTRVRGPRSIATPLPLEVSAGVPPPLETGESPVMG